MQLDTPTLRDLLSKSLDEKEIDALFLDFEQNKSSYISSDAIHSEELLLLQHLEFNYSNPLYSHLDTQRMNTVIQALKAHFNIDAEFSFQAEDQNSFSLPQLARQYVESSKTQNSISVLRELRLLLGNLALRTLRRPLLIVKRQALRKGKLLKNMLGDPVTAEMWYSIEYVSPIYNRFLFKLPYRRQLRGDTDIVDLVFFAIQTGDEYLDGVIDDMREAGRLDELAETLKQNPRAWEFTIDENKAIQVSKDLNRQVGEEIRQGRSEKYAKSYEQLFNRLVLTIEDINARLADKPDRAEKAEAICDYFNFCLATSKDDIYFINLYTKTPVPLGYLRWHFHKKNNLVMIRWIELRARFLELPLVDEKGKFEWGSFLHIGQLFDDLRDIKIDYRLQPNIIHSLSFYHYPEEWDWFLKNQYDLEVHLPLHQMLDVNFNMCLSVLHCMTLARAEGLENMSWLTIKGAHLHWEWHWMSSSSKYKDGGSKQFLLGNYFKEYDSVTNNYLIDISLETISRLRKLWEVQMPIELRLGYVFDMLMYDSRFRKAARKMASWREKYLLKMNGFFISPEVKINILKAVLRRNGVAEYLKDQNSLGSPQYREFLNKKLTEDLDLSVTR